MNGSTARANQRLFVTLAGVVVAMVGLSFAAVPLYEAFCRVTGFGGTTQRADAITSAPVDRAMKVRFTASTHRDMPISFRADQPSQSIKVGEQALAFFTVTNPTTRPVTGVATFNVTPNKAGPYFAKLDCFCFDEQTLAPGESRRMPVAYFVDPELVSDPLMDGVGEITLSYTFFEATDGAES